MEDDTLALQKTEVIPDIQEPSTVMDLATFISGDELAEGIKVKFLSNPFENGTWESSFLEEDAKEMKKWTILCILLKEDESAQLRRIDTGKNFLSFLIAEMFIKNISDLRGKVAEIKRRGSKINTSYLIKIYNE